MLFLALRYLLSRKRQTALIALGIVLGTTGYVAISGMMMGFQSYLLEKLVNHDAHIHITPREEYITAQQLNPIFFKSTEPFLWLSSPSGRRDSARIENPASWQTILDSDARVLSYSERFSTQAILSHGDLSAAVQLVGTDPSKQILVSNIQNDMTEGNFSDLSAGGNRLVIGEALLKKIGLRVSDTVQVSLGKGQWTPFRIVGAYQSGIQSVDEGTVYAALPDVQRIYGMPGAINSISVKLKDYHIAAATAKDWSQYYAEKVESWDQINASTLSIFKTQDIVRYTMTGSILVVAGFGIYNVLNMMILQKRREIAILRSVGFESRDVLFIFAAQGVLLGLVGGLLGLGLGYLGSLWVSSIKIEPGRFTVSSRMMVSFAPIIYIRGLFLALFASIVASYWPARFAGKLTPIDIIRSGGD